MDAILTRSYKGQLVIPVAESKDCSVQALIGCTGYQGPAVPLEQMDSALFASSPVRCCLDRSLDRLC